jgi:hypothetical protein
VQFEALADDGQAEEFVHVSSGIHGGGDLDPSMYDWRSAMAKVRVVRID